MAMAHGYGAVARVFFLNEHVGERKPYDVASPQDDSVLPLGFDIVEFKEFNHPVRGSWEIARRREKDSPKIRRVEGINVFKRIDGFRDCSPIDMGRKW